MKLPFNYGHFPQAPFSLFQLNDWVALRRPLNIEMDDRQYAHLAHLCGYNPKDYRGIPIVFFNAPKGSAI
jgi:hypothetical protein